MYYVSQIWVNFVWLPEIGLHHENILHHLDGQVLTYTAQPKEMQSPVMPHFWATNPNKILPLNEYSIKVQNNYTPL